MMKATSLVTCILSALVVAGILGVFYAQPAAAQSAKKLKCTGCVKTKQLKNNGVMSEDIGNGQVKNADLGIGAVTGAKVQNGSLTGVDIQDGSIGPADLAPGTALGLSGVAVIPSAAFTGATASHPLNAGYVTATSPLFAPVHLPDGAVVESLVVHVWDNNTVSSPVITLHRTESATGITSGMAQIIPSANGAFIQELEDTTIGFPTVDLANYHYFIQTGATADLRFYAMRVFYR